MSAGATLTQEQLNSFLERVTGTTLDMGTVLEDEYGVPGGVMGLSTDSSTDIDAQVLSVRFVIGIAAVMKKAKHMTAFAMSATQQTKSWRNKMAQMEASQRDRTVAAQLDGHYCYDWDGLAVSAWTPEYDCCVCYKKTRRGRLVNWFYMQWFYWKEARVRAKEENPFRNWGL